MKRRNGGLIKRQESQLARLMSRVRWPLAPNVFHALMGMAVSVPIELAVFDDNGHILTFYREDAEYKGEHILGTVLQGEECIADAIKRLLASEVVGGKVTPPISLGHKEIPKGNGPGENPTRHEVSLLHACWLVGSYAGKGGKFSPVDNLPENILPHHRVLVAEIVKRLVAR